MNYLFSGCSSLKEINLKGKFSTENVYDLSGLFTYCYSLEEMDMSHLNMKKAMDLSNLFHDCWKIKTIVFPKEKIKNVINMTRIFCGCKELTFVDLGDCPDLLKMFNGFNVEEED